MKNLYLILATIATIGTLFNFSDLQNKSAFDQWKETHHKSYETFEEEQYRRLNYENNLKMYQKRNQEEPLATFGPDQFSDLSQEEFKSIILDSRIEESYSKYEKDHSQESKNETPVVQSINWVTKGAVTSVKNQGSYGTCWSFGAVGVLEGINQIHGNQLVSLANQELIDCCSSCSGMPPTVSWNYLQQNTQGEIDTNESYPYKGAVGSCKASQGTVSQARVASNQFIQNGSGGNQDNLVSNLVSQGPANIGVDAASCLMGYKSGIISNCKGVSRDHATLMVGAGETSGTPYFLVKNSWGASWGVNGYYMFARNTGQLDCNGAYYAKY